MVATERIAARGDPRHADRPRVHWPPCKRVTPRLRRGLARGDREGGAVDRLAGGVPDDLPLHPVLHDVLRNIVGAGFLRPFPAPTYSVSRSALRLAIGNTAIDTATSALSRVDCSVRDGIRNYLITAA